MKYSGDIARGSSYDIQYLYSGHNPFIPGSGKTLDNNTNAIIMLQGPVIINTESGLIGFDLT
jgi:hypothetical protein